jgi:hypothetical protein
LDSVASGVASIISVSRWRSKKALRWVLAVCLLVSAAAAVLWTQLPAMVERRATERLRAAGFTEARLQVTAVGLRRLELSNLSLANGPWRVHLARGVARYRPLALLRSGIESLRFEGLEVSVDLQAAQTTPAPTGGVAVSWTGLVNRASAELPLRRLSVSNGVLRLRRGAVGVALPFAVALTNDRIAQHLHVDAQARGTAETLHLEGVLDPRTGGRVTAEFALTNAISWLGLMWPGHLDLPASLQPSRVSPFEGLLEIRVPAGQEDAQFSGSLRPFQVQAAAATMATGPTTYRGQHGQHGVTDLRLTTVLDELAYSDWLASAGAVSLELDNLETLKATLERVELAGAGGLDATGDVTLVAGPRVPGQTNPARYHGSLDLVHGNIVIAGANLQGAKLSGGIDFTPRPENRVASPGARSDWLSRQLGAAAGWVAEAGIDLHLAAVRLILANGLQIDEPEVRLRRSATTTTESARSIELTGLARAVHYRGLALSSWEGAGAIQSDVAWLRGAAKLGEQPFSYSLEFRPAGDGAAGPGFTGTFSLGTLQLRDRAIPAALVGGQPMRVTGDLDVAGSIRLGPSGQGEVRPRVRLALERIEWPQKKLTVHGLRGAVRWGAPEGAGALDAEEISVEAIRFGDYELTNARARLEWLSHRLVRVQLVDAQFFDGHVRMPPFVWDLETGNFEPVLVLEDVNLTRLAKLLPQFSGSIDGYLNGRLPFTVKAWKAKTTGGRLELNRLRPARIQYPADGLLTRGLAADSDRFRQLKLMEEGLKDLRLEVLTIDLYDPERPQTPVRVHLEGTFTSPRAIVPIIFNLNVNGDLDQALRLLNLGDLQISLD